MDIVINTTRLDNFFSLPPEQMLWVFFLNIGWMLIALMFLYGLSLLYLQKIRVGWAAKNLRFILLAIDVPKGNEQSPKAVENMFTYLAGAHGSINFFEKWFEGKFQVSFSYEVVSLEGYTQFLIRTPIEFRNLIETSVYSQYPDAEISEVDDYVEAVPHKFPDEEYDIWGAEFMQANNWAFPIKLYQEFEHSFGESETQFKDPMASLMDLCSSLREGEQFWFQIVVIPTGFDWMESTEKIVDKILNKKKKSNSIIMKMLEWFGDFGEMFFSIWGDIEKKEEKDSGLSMMELTPKQKKQIEAIQMKASKLAFEAKIRVVYASRKDVINRSKVVNGFVGYMKQFVALDLNNLKPDVKITMTKTAYFNKSKRLIKKKNSLMRNYVSRDDFAGRLPGIFNIEELATLWHFPIEANVKAPMIQKAPGRKADAPSSLPISEDFTRQAPELFQSDILQRKSLDIMVENRDELASNNNVEPSTEGESIPENLPFV
ncbi:MAG: hypothetical protein PHE20_02345 [Patescibacteria group bacterium]|nr:hypothetical protein [Patescibacteria group bacterium]